MTKTMTYQWRCDQCHIKDWSIDVPLHWVEVTTPQRTYHFCQRHAQFGDDSGPQDK